MNIQCLDGPALPFILQRASSEPADIANLLLTSKSVHSAVLATCKGTIAVFCHKAAINVPSFTTWVAKYGQLMYRLHFWPYIPVTDSPAAAELKTATAEQALAAALQQATGSGPLALQAHESASEAFPSLASTSSTALQLRFFGLYQAGKHAAAILQQLPGCTLTGLKLHVRQPSSNGETPSEYLRSFSTSLSHLTNLRSLNVSFRSSHSISKHKSLTLVEYLLPQLTGLTKITKLIMDISYNVVTDAAIQLLPNSIQVLEFWHTAHMVCEADTPWLHLSHLTALTCLRQGSKLPRDCKLPPNLVELHVSNLMDSACLLPLRSLQNLELQQSGHDTDASLRHLSALTSLTHAKVSFDHVKDLNLSGCALRTVPLRELSITGTIAEHNIYHLGQLTQLTCLRLEQCRMECSLEAFQRVLKKMVQLKVFALGRVKGAALFQHAHGQTGDEHHDDVFLHHIFAALAGLHHLQDLHLQGLPMGLEAASSLASSIAGQLTALRMNDCSLQNMSMTAIIVGSPRLQELNIKHNELLDDTILPVAKTRLSELYFLDCSHTGITKSGCSRFAPGIPCSGGPDNNGEIWVTV